MPTPRIATVTLNAAIDKRYVVGRLEVPGVNRVSECTYSAGGKGLNVARVAALAGAQVTATGFLGGHAGAFIAQQLDQQGITARFVPVAGESRSCINIYDSTTGQVTELLEPGCGVGDGDVQHLLELVHGLVQQVDVLTLSGSAPQGAPVDIYAQLIDIALAAARPVILDTSAPWLAPGLAAHPTLIKPNQDELNQLLSAPVASVPDAGPSVSLTGSALRMASRLRDSGISYVVLSQGARGATLVSADGQVTARPPRVEAVNTVGCGDAMVAALALGLARGDEPAQLLRYAVAVSAAAAADPGTGSFDPALAAHLLDQVSVQAVR